VVTTALDRVRRKPSTRSLTAPVVPFAVEALLLSRLSCRRGSHSQSLSDISALSTPPAQIVAVQTTTQARASFALSVRQGRHRTATATADSHIPPQPIRSDRFRSSLARRRRAHETARQRAPPHLQFARTAPTRRLAGQAKKSVSRSAASSARGVTSANLSQSACDSPKASPGIPATPASSMSRSTLAIVPGNSSKRART